MKLTKSIKTISGMMLNIYKDAEAVNPRLGETSTRMLFLHRTERMGDVHCYNSPKEIEDIVDSQEDAMVLPVFMLQDPTGFVLLSLEPLESRHERSETGQLGLMYMCKKDIEDQLGFMDGSSKEARQQAYHYMDQELEQYNEWLNSEVYCYQLVDNVGKIIQQESGFYGCDHEISGLLEDAQVEIEIDGTARHQSELGKEVQIEQA